MPAEADEYSSSNYEITAVPANEGVTVEYSSVSEPDYKIRYVSLDDHNYIEVRTSQKAVGLLQIKVKSGKKTTTYSVIIFVEP